MSSDKKESQKEPNIGRHQGKMGSEKYYYICDYHSMNYIGGGVIQLKQHLACSYHDCRSVMRWLGR